MLSVNTPARRALVALVLALVAALLVVAPRVTGDAAPPADTPAKQGQASGRGDGKDREKEPRAGFRMASLNLPHTMSAGAVAHDVRQVIRQGRPSVIGFQERGGSRPAMRAALPRHWGLVMPRQGSGTDLNPLAYDRRVWALKKAKPVLLAGRTWRRARGNTAIEQYGVLARLVHREGRHRVRVLSFHMPSDVHDKGTGGPNWGNADRVHAFWRMADNVVDVARSTKKRSQFIALCDCNVKASRDTTSQLVEGRIVRPLRLMTNYDAGPAPVPFEADYVMGSRGAGYRIVDWRQLNAGLITDHPSPVARFRENRSHYRDRIG
jgi:hypothetical protein